MYNNTGNVGFIHVRIRFHENKIAASAYLTRVLLFAKPPLYLVGMQHQSSSDTVTATATPFADCVDANGDSAR